MVQNLGPNLLHTSKVCQYSKEAKSTGVENKFNIEVSLEEVWSTTQNHKWIRLLKKN